MLAIREAAELSSIDVPGKPSVNALTGALASFAIAAAIAVVTNLVFGLVMAWSVAKFEFRGKSFLSLFNPFPLTQPLVYLKVRFPVGFLDNVSAPDMHVFTGAKAAYL